MLKKIVQILLAAILCFSSVSTGAEAKSVLYKDISSSYARDAIETLTQRGVLTGVGDGLFVPRKPLSRAEFTAMLMRVLNMDAVNNDISAFRDVSKSAWYYGWIHAAVNLSLVSGTGERVFEPNVFITRQEAAVMAARAMKLGNHAVQAGRTVYADESVISSWAKSDVRLVSSAGWMKGDQYGFRPLDFITRQEAAALIDRILNAGNVKRVVDTKAKTKGIRMGWLYNGTTSQYISYAQSAGLNTLVPRWYYVEKDGSVSDYTDQKLLNWSRQSGTAVWGMLGNRSDIDATHSMLQSASARRTVIQSVSDYVRIYKLDGINIDFENVSGADRQQLTLFVRDMAAELHRVGAVLSIDVSPDLQTDWTAAFDYKALGTYADYVVFMGYDQHWGGSPKAGSVSSLPWFTSAMDTMLTVVPSTKSIAAMPLYTRDWKLGSPPTSEDITLIEQGRRATHYSTNLKWKPDIGQYTSTYWLHGFAHRIWMEEARSLSRKHAAAAARNVAGTAYWYSGSETPEVWRAVNNIQRYQHYHFIYAAVE
ncbi:S-layer homology domain-containing protein [Paenibacillus lemnae]|uniref:Glycoside hydrolase n=1 Tax=Paenibacillus lemnae TaxID=1330551 RepID=A0A848M989_PAELE|nr:S-layer homology domain-containing protein [Paenibacillus lemnae]NMO97788.1 glycoside hydrolase [Paenibacillus lemnae]